MSQKKAEKKKDDYILQVITPTGIALEKEVTFTKLPGETGEVGVLRNHTPALIQCHAGKIRIHESNGETHKYFIPSGFSQILQDKVIVLTPYLENADEINPERAEKAKKRALDRLHTNDQMIDLNRARKALFRAERRLYIHKLKHKDQHK